MPNGAPKRLHALRDFIESHLDYKCYEFQNLAEFEKAFETFFIPKLIIFTCFKNLDTGFRTLVESKQQLDSSNRIGSLAILDSNDESLQIELLESGVMDFHELDHPGEILISRLRVILRQSEVERMSYDFKVNRERLGTSIKNDLCSLSTTLLTISSYSSSQTRKSTEGKLDCNYLEQPDKECSSLDHQKSLFIQAKKRILSSKKMLEELRKLNKVKNSFENSVAIDFWKLVQKTFGEHDVFLESTSPFDSPSSLKLPGRIRGKFNLMSLACDKLAEHLQENMQISIGNLSVTPSTKPYSSPLNQFFTYVLTFKVPSMQSRQCFTFEPNADKSRFQSDDFRLPIVKQLFEAAGAQIWVKSDKSDQTCTICIDLKGEERDIP